MRFVLPLVAVAAFSNTVGVDAFVGWFSSSNANHNVDLGTERELVVSCFCGIGSTAGSFKCGTKVYYCASWVDSICANQLSSVPDLIALDDTMCAIYQQLELQDTCPSVNGEGESGLSNRVCYDGNTGSKTDDEGCTECTSLTTLDAYASATNKPTSKPTTKPTTAPTPATEVVVGAESPDACVSPDLLAPQLERILGNAPAYEENAVTLEEQALDEVTFTVANKWNVGDITVSLPSTGCDASSLASGATGTYTATCTGGYADITVSFGTGSCSSGVGYELTLPCAPVCAPGHPTCLDESIVQLADIDYESEPSLCIYSDNPIVITSMSDDSVTFELVDTWPADISAVSVSYTDVDGNIVCDPIDGLQNLNFRTDPITAMCTEGMTDVTVAVHSLMIDFEASTVRVAESCSPSTDVGTCGYIFTVPCGKTVMCNPPPEPDCVSADLLGPKLVNTIGTGSPFIDSALTLGLQSVDEVTFTVTNAWSTGDVAVSVPTGCSAPSGLLPGESGTYTATCSNGFAIVKVYLGSGTCADTTDMEYHVSVPCVPICEPGIPECLDEPLVQIADLDYGSEEPVCIYSDNPVVVKSMSTTAVVFELVDTWPADISAVSVFYPVKNGTTVCELIEGLQGLDFTTNPFTATCGEDMTTDVKIAIHSISINHEAEFLTLPEYCNPATNVGTCSYEFTIPCSENLSCTTTLSPTGSPTITPTPLPTSAPSENPSGSFYPSSAPSETPTDSPAPSATPSTSPSTRPSAAPSVSPSIRPSAAPSASPSGSPSTSPSASPSDSPSSSPSVSPSAGPSSAPSTIPTVSPSSGPTVVPSARPSAGPSSSPSAAPSTSPSTSPSSRPSTAPSAGPSETPSASPSAGPSAAPSASPSDAPSSSPSENPSGSFYPSSAPSEPGPECQSVYQPISQSFSCSLGQSICKPK
jgi:hypothetical protein